MLLLLVLLQFTGISHEGATAEFDLTWAEERFKLTVSVEEDALLHAYERKTGNTKGLSQESKFIAGYLAEHLALTVNQRKVDFELQQFTNKAGQYHAVLTSSSPVANDVRQIRLKNTSFLEGQHGHYCLVNFDLNGKYRTFRLHEGRTAIELNY